MKKDESFESKISHTDIFIYLTDGEIELIFPKEAECGCSICGCDIPDEDDNESKKYRIKKNQMFMFEKDVKHHVKALKDSKFLLVKI